MLLGGRYMSEVTYELKDELTPEFILSRIPEENIYQKYLGIMPEIGEQYCNPLRKDKNPTCSFAILKDKLVFRDWSEPIYWDVFDVVQKKYGVNFHEAMEIVATDFGLMNGKVPDPIRALKLTGKKQKKVFHVQVQPFMAQDLRYLEQYGITRQIAEKFGAFSIKNLTVNGVPKYRYSLYDPAIGHYFGLNRRNQQKWKIQFYYRGKIRFLSNTSRFNGWDQLPESGNILVITKSMKDVMTLYRLGVHAVAPQGESTIIRKETIHELKRRFRHIASLYDFDEVGIKAALRLKREHRIPAYMLTTGRWGTKDFGGSKDISDYVKDKGLTAAQNLINYEIDKIIHGTSTNTGNP